jgi:putative tricarboxylic transport membrane protein
MREQRVRWAPFRLVSLMVVGLAAAFIALSLNLPVGTFAAPGAGAWPLAVSALMGVAALALLLSERGGEDYESLSKRLIVVAAGVGLMASYIVAFSFIGLTIPSLLFAAVWLRCLAGERWRVVVVATLVFTAIFVIVFAILLQVPTPHDPLLSLILTGRL